jgi:hypothetical protein
MSDVIEDVRSFDPIAYVRAIGLRPEDCYGFLPIEHEDVTPYLYLYRDRPDYERARAELPYSQPQTGLGPIPIDPAEQAEMDMDRELPGGAGGRLGRLIAGAQEMAEAYGGGQPPAMGAPVAPDPEELGRLAKLRSSGQIDDQEYMRLVNEEISPAAGRAPDPVPGAPGAGGGAPADPGTIVAQRLYPGLRSRSSTRQLDHFLPRYREALGLRSEDVYGVLPRTTRHTARGGDAADSKQWDDFWIVHRDRPDYAQGREEWAREMGGEGRWPGTVVSAGAGQAPAIPFDGARVRVEKDLWPRHTVVVRQRGEDLGESLRKRIAKHGYEPEDSLGFCPSFPNESIYFAWRES